MKFTKIMETCIYSSNLKEMKEFYQDKLGLEVVSEEMGRHVFFNVGKNMLLIFNPKVTMHEKETKHGAITPPAMNHFAFEIKKDDFQATKMDILNKNIEIEKEVTWKNGGLSIYFRDPAGNLVEIITDNLWQIQ
jgi:catechol 2,3-dioxygenase-like lactoylglutathione lyase family enzyme